MHSLQRPKVRRYTTMPLIRFNTYDSRFNNIHIDLVSPLPTYQSYSYLLTCIDWFTHWPEAIPIPNITCRDSDRGFCRSLDRSFWSSFDYHHDRQSQFESALWTQLMEILGARHIHTTAYHIKRSCRAFLLPTKNDLEVSTNTY